MKISIKEIKVEDDGCELLYVRDIGLILKSETFSGAIKQCQKQSKEKDPKTEKQSIPIEALIPLIPDLTQIISEILSKSKGESELSEKPLEDPKKEE